ncbi:hemerythrin domain-containing protein [Kitasatospora sp. NBC_00240]|uniref:hemerythrin domain-containing protein n=1 Tax=Kitasatospora sp. NBC_00240 TaxID=2903567 RepID=UPI00224DCC47|nr:hemerythrin domain-containing protein [Kitasatospora sp. NBC_00240]MCX5213847.1 hemerythrin domain-containing protein [Kitasatospora sp. NBC_00240]
MSRRADVVDELSADHRAVAELLARIEKAAPNRAGAGSGAAAPPAAGPPDAERPGTPQAPPQAEPAAVSQGATAPDGAGASPDADAGGDPGTVPGAVPGAEADPGVVALVEGLSDLLLSHCTEEEEYLFPAVHEQVPDGGSLVFTSLADHLAIGQYLTDLQGLSPGDPAFAPLLEGLGSAVHTHLAEEDERLFPAVRKAMTAELLAALGERLREGRRALPPLEPPAPAAPAATPAPAAPPAPAATPES